MESELFQQVYPTPSLGPRLSELPSERDRSKPSPGWQPSLQCSKVRLISAARAARPGEPQGPGGRSPERQDM